MLGRIGKLSILWGLPLLVSFNLTASVASKGGPRQSWRSDISTLKPDDIPVPIPLSLRLPFPWELTQGIWRAKKGEFQSCFFHSGSFTAQELKRIRFSFAKLMLSPVMLSLWESGK